MADEITVTNSVAEIVVKHPETRKPLEAMGIDYCCGGKHTLKEACENSGLSPQDVVQKLIEAVEYSDKERLNKTNLDVISLKELIDHITNTHHVFLKEELTLSERKKENEPPPTSAGQ
jgi:regulator of cell morphogenesis and NO signaling